VSIYLLQFLHEFIKNILVFCATRDENVDRKDIRRIVLSSVDSSVVVESIPNYDSLPD